MLTSVNIFNYKSVLQGKLPADYVYLREKLLKAELSNQQDIETFICKYKGELTTFYIDFVKSVNFEDTLKISHNEIIEKTEKFKFKKIIRKFIFTDLFILDMLQAYFPDNFVSLSNTKVEFDNIPFELKFFVEEMISRNSFIILILLSLIDGNFSPKLNFMENLFNQYIEQRKTIFPEILDYANSKYLLWKDTDVGGYVICNCENYVITQGETKQNAIEMIKEAEELLSSTE